MSTPAKKDHPLGTTAATARLHTIIRRVCYVLLFALVIEGAFTLPFTMVWYGWPTLSIQEICSGLRQVSYSDPTLHCKSEPLGSTPFSSGAVNSKAKANDRWGIQPTPEYKSIGFRELIKIYRHNQELAGKTPTK